ncbi:tape measure domain protein [Acinetobacter junii SH205]|uniref:Tape measure domain protein n=1 Tax=Acinetobacter junii SH205 TaxID=575587 RepID=D0SJK1_ACIJU|nr:tape measure protein [Acinetobacter junii]EEY94023.1 tape measure domain protein [Acinetobacter junii SH205]
MATKLGTLTLDLVAKIGNYTAPLSKAEQQTKATTQRISADMSKGASAIDMLGDSASRTTQILGSLVATAGIGFSVSELIKYSDTYTGLNNRLKLVTTSETQLATAVKDTFEIAQKSRSSWETTAAIYQRFAQNSDRLGLSQERVASITETVSKAVAISGASTESANAAMMQFGQALASGVLRGEEFNSINEQTPAVLDAIAKGLDVQRAALKSMAEEGKLTTDVLIKALEKADQSVQDLFGKTDVTIGQSFTYLNNEITKFVGESGKGSGAATALSSSVMVLANNLDLLTNAAMVGGAYLAGSYISSLVATTVASVKNTLATAANTAATKTKILADYELAKAELAASAAMVRSMGATNAETAALVANSRAAYQKAAASKAAMLSSASLLGVLGGPVGLGLTVASVAAGYLLMRGNGDQANKMLGDQSRYASLATGELEKLSGAQLRAAEKELSNQLMLQSGHLQKAKNDFEALTESVLDSNKGNQEAYRIWAELRTGVITTEQAFNKLNQAKFVTSDQINALADSQSKIIQHEGAVKKLNEQLNKTRESGANAANGIKAIGNAADETKVSIEVLNKALGKLTDQRTDSQYVMNTAKNLGGDIEKAKALLEYRKQLGLGSVGRQLTPQERKPFEDSYAALRALKAYEDNIAESKKTSLKLSKQQTSEYEKQQKKLDQIKEQKEREREDIKYLYGNAFNKDEMNLDSELKRINEAGFSPEHRQGYINAALSRAKINQELFVAEQEFEINQFQYTEEQKLAAELALNKRRVDANFDLNDQMIEAHKASLEEQYKNAVSWAELEKQQRLLDARQFYMSDAEYMQERYKLERDEIAKNLKLTQQERDARIAMKLAEEEFEKRKNLKSASMAWGQSYADMTGTGAQFQIEQDRFSRYDESNALFESQIALAETAEQREAIWQAHNDRMRMIDESYWNGTKAYQLGMAADVFGGLSGVMLNFVDESSSSYQALVAIQKGANLASVLMNSVTAISAAWASAPFPYNLPAVAMATVETGALQATLQAFTPNISGMAHNGIDNIPKEGTWLLDGGERVLNPEQNKDLTNYLSQVQTGGQNRPIDNKLSVIMVKDEDEAKNYKYSKDFEDAVLYHIKRNRSKI